MNTTPLSPSQQSILYSMLYHMVGDEGLNLSSAAQTAQATSDTLNYCRNVTASILNIFSTITEKQQVFSPFLGNIQRKLSRGTFESIYFLARAFDVQRSEYNFPGITPASVVDEDEEDTNAEEQCYELVAGDLRREFPNADIRTAFISAMER